MAENVTQALADRATSLLEKLVTNPDLCNMVLALLGRCIVMCQQLGRPIEGIEMGELQNSTLPNGDLVARSQVSFRPMSISAPAMFALQSDFAQYTRARAQGLGLALQKNPRMAVFFQKLVEALDTYARHKDIQFGALVVKQAIISNPGDVLVLKVGRHLLDSCAQ